MARGVEWVRYPSLDLLRLVAVTMTLLAHASGVVSKVFFLRPFQGSLWLGVDLFMLISGWLLGGQLLREAQSGPPDAWRFYVKRWLRTLPPYYFMLLMLYCFGTAQTGGVDGTELVLDTHRSDPSLPGLPYQTILTHLAFLQRYIPPNLYSVSWSLCVEEHFYLLLPAIVSLLRRFSSLAFVVLLVVGVEAAALVFRDQSFGPMTWAPQQSHMRSHGLFLGLLLAWVNIHRPALWSRLGAFATRSGGVGVLTTLAVMATTQGNHPTRWTYVWVPTLGTWTLALIFFAAVHARSSWSRFDFRGLRYLGELTYSIYLVHNVLPRAWLGEHSGQAGLKGVLLRLILVCGFSLLLHHVIERPALKLRTQLLQRWTSKPPRTLELSA